MFRENKEKAMQTQLNLFKEHMISKEEYDYYNGLYKSIRSEYERQILNDKLNVDVEKCRLKAGAANYGTAGITRVFNTSMVVISLFVNIMAAVYSLSGEGGRFGAVLLFAIPVNLIIICSIFMYASMNRKKETLYNICFKVLEDIEAEEEKERMRLIEATRQREEAERFERQLEASKASESKSSGISTLLLPAAFEMAAGKVKKVGLLKKLFNWKKK
jgi:hypothetical protein